MVPLSPRLLSHRPNRYFLFKNSSKNLGVESHWLSLGPMTITEAITMVSLGHVHISAPRAWDGARKKGSSGKNVRDAVNTQRACLHHRRWRMAVWQRLVVVVVGGVSLGRQASEWQRPATWQGGSDPNFIRLRKV